MPIVAEQPAPDFEAVAHDGTTVRLSDSHGRWILLWFYPEADTPDCTTEACGLNTQAQQFASMHCDILGVSFDDQAKNAAFADKFGLKFRLLCDTDQRLGALYDAIETTGPDAGWPKRISFLIDPSHTVVRVYDPVNPKMHATTVLHDLRVLAD